MKIAKIVLACIAVLTVIGSPAYAEQTITGTITKLDRISGSIAIRREENVTVGANTGGVSEQFKTQTGLPTEAVHAGDKVMLFITETGGIRTVTKIQKQ